MIKKLRELFNSPEIPPVEKVLNIILAYIELGSFGAMLLFIYMKMTWRLIAILLFAMIFVAFLYFFVNITKKYELACNIICYFMNLIVFPLLFIYGGGIFSGMPILFIGGFILTMILLNGIALLIASSVILLWYLFIMTFLYYNPLQIQLVLSGKNLLFDIMICFVECIVFYLLIFYIYTRLYLQIQKHAIREKLELEENSKIKSSFLANMSHELRTPMNAIIGMTELIEQEDKENHILSSTETIKNSAYSLLTTINNILTYSKITSGKMHLIKVQFSFKKLLKDLIYTINLELFNKNIDFFVDVDAQIPDLLYGDDTLIKQVFQYIFFITLATTEEGRIQLAIKYKENEKTNSITLFVDISDTGLGFDTEEIKSIFHSFEQYDSRKDSQLRKMGLELTICREILSRMNGSIEVESIFKVGSAIHFQFDCFVVEKNPMMPEIIKVEKKVLIYTSHENRAYLWKDLMSSFSVIPEIVKSTPAFEAKIKENSYTHFFMTDECYEHSSNLIQQYGCEERTYIVTDHNHIFGDFGNCRILRKPIYCLNMYEALNQTWKKDDYCARDSKEAILIPDANILLVDDNLVNLKVISGILSRYEINTTIATSGREAVQKVQMSHYDMILLDQLMPEMDGISTLHIIRSLDNPYYKEIPIICMTAFIGKEFREEMIKEGFQEYLAKPVKIRYLENVLREYLPPNMIQSGKKSEIQNNNAAMSNTANISNEKDEQYSLELDVQKGMQQIGGDKESYDAILNTYYTEGLEKIKTIQAQFIQGQVDLFTINVHSIKGSSASVGAMGISEIFRNLEMAGKKNDQEYIKKHLNTAIESFQIHLKEVKKYLEEEKAYEKEEDLGDQIHLILSDLKNIDFESCEKRILKTTLENHGEQLNKMIRQAKEAYEQFDYRMVRSIFEEILKLI